MVLCTIPWSMYDALINAHPPISVELETRILLLASILLDLIMTDESDFSLRHAHGCTGKLSVCYI